MNQFLLFLRSVAISIVVFLVLAFFAARFFGGTLFPRSPRVDFPAVTLGGHSYFLSVTRDEGKSPSFSLRQVDATDPGNSVLVAPQSGDDSAAWSWAEPISAPGGGREAVPAGMEASVAVRFMQRDGRTGWCAVDPSGKVTFRLD